MFLVLVIFCVLYSAPISGLRISRNVSLDEDTTIFPSTEEDLFPNVFNSTDSFVVVTLPPNVTIPTQLPPEDTADVSFPGTKQIAPPSNPVEEITKRMPCRCLNGLCACCTGVLMQALRTKGCMNLRYIPEDFAFQFEMKMNDLTLYKNKISGKNPPPICINPPRIGFIEVCANFYDVYFAGKNMHVCMEMGGYFQGFELFSRSFDCLRVGDKGVKIMKPEDDEFRPTSSSIIGGSVDAEVDQGDDIEDYDENVVRRFDKN
ncbi:uncharacterized protein DMENIID0001_136240 [Sergentomyia squamirostris]